MLRLWNMLDGRCNFKKKCGLNKEDDKRVAHKIQKVIWEGKFGDTFAIMYEKQVEIMKVDEDLPINFISSDSLLTCIAFINENELIMGD
jgi:hypothetical protein